MAKHKAADTFLVNGGEVKRSKYIALVASEESKKHNATIRKDDVEKILKMVEKDKELATDAPIEYQKVYDRIIDDYATLEGAAEAAEAEAAAASKELEAKRTGELAIVDEALSHQDGETLAKLTQKFDFGANLNQCVPRGKVTPGEITAMLALQLGMENATQWAIGDLVNQLEDLNQENVALYVCDKVGKAYSTVSGYARVCRALEPGNGRDGLPFTSFREIFNAKLADNQDANLKCQLALLKDTRKNGWGTAEVRTEVKRMQGKPTGDELPHELDSARFVCVTAKGEIWQAKGFKNAKKAAGSGGTIIHGRTFYTGKGETKWADIEEFAEAETDPNA
ncbi:MAG: hypothetical protein JW388_0971 [Nitrospira sp.]|nr:hypothetical protein [Nitrospira sp.]